MTPDELKLAAVDIVSNFLNKKISLDRGVADFSKASSLNDEQTKRLVEVVNQIAYLKIHSISSDKTFEFPVCSYEGVSKILTGKPEMSKAASVNRKLTPMEWVSRGMEKAASTETVAPAPTLSFQEKMFIYDAEENLIEKLSEERDVIICMLHGKAREVAKDPGAMNKIASLDISLAKQKLLVNFAGLSGELDKKAELFNGSDLTAVRQYSSILDDLEKINNTILTKQASLEKFAETSRVGQVGNAVGETIGSLTGHIAGKIGRGAVKGAYNVGKGAGKLSLAVGPGKVAEHVSRVMYASDKGVKTRHGASVMQELYSRPTNENPEPDSEEQF